MSKLWNKEGEYNLVSPDRKSYGLKVKFLGEKDVSLTMVDYERANAREWIVCLKKQRIEDFDIRAYDSREDEAS